jgi:hypothetical protein
MKVLLDNGIVSWAEFATGAAKDTEITCDGITQTVTVYGLLRKQVASAKQKEKIELLPTIGHAIRNRAIQAFSYIELGHERTRRCAIERRFNALQGCEISRIPSAIERSKLTATHDYALFISKGGKKDEPIDPASLVFTQVGFVERLLTFSSEAIEGLLKHQKQIGLTAFEAENFQHLDELRDICKAFGSRENYPDAFYYWTAHRNQIDVFLTLEDKLPNLSKNLFRAKRKSFRPYTQVLDPLALLDLLGITERVAVPMDEGRFYNLL